MSDYETHKGRLEHFPRKKNEQDKEYLQRLLDKLQIPFDEEAWEEQDEDVREFIGWTTSDNEYFYVNNKLYINVDHKEMDDEDIFEFSGNDEIGYTYLMRFYNGAYCLNEGIEDSLSK